MTNFRGEGTYVFVDGNYLYGPLREAAKTIYGVEPVFQSDYAFGPIEKLFFFDALGPEAEISEDERARAKFHESVKSHPGHHLRHGRSVRRTGRGNRNVIQQKQVDVLLAVTVMEYAFRHVAKNVVIFAGDQDFVPLVESLVSAGVPVTVMGYEKNLSKELIDAADSHRAMDRLAMLYMHKQFRQSNIHRSAVEYRDLQWQDDSELGFDHLNRNFVTQPDKDGCRICGKDPEVVLRVAKWVGHCPVIDPAAPL